MCVAWSMPAYTWAVRLLLQLPLAVLDFECLVSARFRELFESHGFILPATFAECHTGGQHNTYVGTMGFEGRIDYIAVSDLDS